MSVEYVLFVLRIVFVFALYFFIVMIARVLSREIAVSGESPGGARAGGRGGVLPGYAYLVIVDGADSGILPGTAIRIGSGALVGRAPGCDVQLADAYTSSEHARFREERGQWLIEDQRSMNGSYVNGQRVNGTHPLADGDTVQLGRIVVQFMRREPA